jgi:hypothetical protein
MVSKRTGIIITAVMAVLFGCAGMLTCLSGLLAARTAFESFGLGPGLRRGLFVGLGAEICTSLAFIALPIVFYVVLVANHKPESPAEAEESAQ